MRSRAVVRSLIDTDTCLAGATKQRVAALIEYWRLVKAGGGASMMCNRIFRASSEAANVAEAPHVTGGARVKMQLRYGA